ncbi:hypothetical protein [Candidatus Nitrospira salsa]
MIDVPFHKRVVIGIEIEAYSINVADHSIGRRLSRPKPGTSEDGERFTRDASIGSEYNSRPFQTVRESLFLLKAGLRKYMRNLYRSRDEELDYRIPLLVGGWTNRFAGTHLHISLHQKALTQSAASSLARHIHDQIPFFIALGANSPIWNRRMTGRASNRVLRGSNIHFVPGKKGQLTSINNQELVYSPGRKTKPATLELRVLDSNVPEYIVAALCCLKAVCLRWLRGLRVANSLTHPEYLQARMDTATKGLCCHIPWRGDWLPLSDYLDRFLWEHREEFELMDIPDEIFEVLRLLKCGYNGSRLLHDAVLIAQHEHPQTWQRRFAKRYQTGLTHLLSGNTLHDFAQELRVPLPNTQRVWLGRERGSIDE